MTLGAEIRRLRLERFVSQKQLATAVGRSRGYVAHLEADRRRPSRALLARIADALGLVSDTSLCALLPTRAPQADPPSKELRHAVLWVLRSPTLQAELAALIEIAVAKSLRHERRSPSVAKRRPAPNHPWNAKAVVPRDKVAGAMKIPLGRIV